MRSLLMTNGGRIRDRLYERAKQDSDPTRASAALCVCAHEAVAGCRDEEDGNRARERIAKKEI